MQTREVRKQEGSPRKLAFFFAQIACDIILVSQVRISSVNNSK